MKKTTVRHVAEHAGVAVGTVSRVLNRNSTVNPVLRQRVEEAIRKLNYAAPRQRPGVEAGAPTISFVLSNRRFLHPVHAFILNGVEEYCRDLGYLVVYTSFEYRREVPWNQLTLPRVLTDHKIADCLILAGMNYENFADALANAGIPHIIVANKLLSTRPRPAVDAVRWDDCGGAYQATSYLLQLGHTRIAYIGDTSVPWCARPYDGYRQAMSEADLEPLAQTMTLSSDPFEEGRMTMELLLESDPSVTAVLADCNVLYGAWETLRTAGRAVPQDVSLIAIGEQYGLLNVQQMTNVSVDLTLVGRTAAQLAVQKIQHGKAEVPEVVLPMSLVTRGTCRPIMSAGKKVIPI